jgi:hypothetical protein
VSPFAAGCAICGADLDTKRWDTGPSGLKRLESWLSALSFGSSQGSSWVWVFVLLFIAFGSSIIGAIVYML